MKTENICIFFLKNIIFYFAKVLYFLLMKYSKWNKLRRAGLQ